MDIGHGMTWDTMGWWSLSQGNLQRSSKKAPLRKSCLTPRHGWKWWSIASEMEPLCKPMILYDFIITWIIKFRTYVSFYLLFYGSKGGEIEHPSLSGKGGSGEANHVGKWHVLPPKSKAMLYSSHYASFEWVVLHVKKIPYTILYHSIGWLKKLLPSGKSPARLRVYQLVYGCGTRQGGETHGRGSAHFRLCIIPSNQDLGWVRSDGSVHVIPG